MRDVADESRDAGYKEVMERDMERQDFEQKKNKADGSERKEWALFDALSGVDEELLERSEKKTAGSKILAFRRYGFIAAAACVMLASGVTLAVQRQARDDGLSGSVQNYVADVAMQGEPETGYDRPVEAACAEAACEDAENGAADDGYEAATGDAKGDDWTGGSDAGGYNENATTGYDSAGGGSATAVSGGQPDADVGVGTESCAIPLDDRKSLTLEEAGSCEYGELLPTTIPEGYRFESASFGRGADGGNVLTVVWVKGMDDIRIFYSRPTEVETVDVMCREQYDVHLYEIPYSDSVPEAYRQTFQHPVFAQEDFSADIVNARMKQVADAGDTDTPGGDFSVLLSSGVLVRFCVEGQPEEIYEMIDSILTFSADMLR